MQSRHAAPKKFPTPNKNKEIKAEGSKKKDLIRFQPKIFDFPKCKRGSQGKNNTKSTENLEISRSKNLKQKRQDTALNYSTKLSGFILETMGNET